MELLSVRCQSNLKAKPRVIIPFPVSKATASLVYLPPPIAFEEASILLVVGMVGCSCLGEAVAICVVTRAGNGGVKVREFVDIFCADPPKPRQSGRRNQPNFTTPNT